MQVLKAFKAGKMASPVSGWLLKKIGTVTADTNVDEVRLRKKLAFHTKEPQRLHLTPPTHNQHNANQQVQRVMARNGWPEEVVRRVIGQQATRAQRRALADAVIFNDGLTLAELRAEVDRVWDAWLARR